MQTVPFFIYLFISVILFIYVIYLSSSLEFFDLRDICFFLTG